MSTNSGKSARQRYVHDFDNMPQGSLLGDKLSTRWVPTPANVSMSDSDQKRGTGHTIISTRLLITLEGAPGL
jgi:hypothetical protein